MQQLTTKKENKCPTSDWVILELIYEQYQDGINFPTLFKFLDGYNESKDKKALRRQINRLNNFLITNKKDGLTYIYPRYKKSEISEMVDLNKQLHTSNKPTKPGHKPPQGVDYKDNPPKIWGLKDWVNTLQNKKWGHINEDGKNIGLGPKAQGKIQVIFNEYLNAIDEKVLAFKNKQPGNKEKKYKLMPYKTRFNCSKRIKRLYAQYNGAWDLASEEYNKGIFLTLTTDPKRFGSLIKATKGMGQAWNRFLSWIGRQLVKCPKCGKIQPIDKLKQWARTETRGQKKYFKCCDQPHRLTKNYHRPDYIKALEFDKGGKPHLHIAIFGCHWLTSKDQITKYWNRTGQGKINYLYPISYNERTDSWKWKNNNNRPSNSRKDVKNYMRKELGKAMGDMARLAFYWITQRRFFTTSKALKSKMPKTELEETIASPKWDFIGSFYHFKMPSYLNGKGPPPPPESPKRNKEILARILEMPK